LEFFANGLLVVSGPEGVNGIAGLNSGEHFLLAETLEDMVKVLKDCITYPEKYIVTSRDGLNFVNKNYSWLNLTHDYINYLNTFYDD